MYHMTYMSIYLMECVCFPLLVDVSSPLGITGLSWVRKMGIE